MESAWEGKGNMYICMHGMGETEETHLDIGEKGRGMRRGGNSDGGEHSHGRGGSFVKVIHGCVWTWVPAYAPG